ncbi:MAG: DJ-1/PfpI family protein, partial [Chitinophagaceae bacterium]
KILAKNVADVLGLTVPAKPAQPINHSIPADGVAAKFQPKYVDQTIEKSAALSMANTPKDSIISRKIAVLATNGADIAGINQMKKMLVAAGAVVEIIAPKLGEIKGDKGGSLKVDKSLMTVSSVLYDAVYLPGGKNSAEALAKEADAVHFINQAYKHCKAIAVDGEATPLLDKTNIAALFNSEKKLPGLILSGANNDKFSKSFINAIAMHRFWERENMEKVPA